MRHRAAAIKARSMMIRKLIFLSDISFANSVPLKMKISNYIPVIASEARQSSATIPMDCFASLAMTSLEQLKLFKFSVFK